MARPGLRSFGDLDLLTDDAEAAQAALLAAGFQEVFEPEIYEDIHHLRPLWWPGLPLVVELHTRAELAGRGSPARRPTSCWRPPSPPASGSTASPRCRPSTTRSCSPPTPGSTSRSGGSGT